MLFVNSFAVVVAYALVLARIVSSTGEKPTTCTTDGCLIAFEANARPASTFCAAYTNPHTAVGSPAATRSAQLYKHRRQASALDPYYTSFIPSTCQPSDLSSACTCHATYTAPPSAVATCSKGQVIVNPSFDGLPPTYAPDISPWTITHVYGDGGCALNLGNPLEAATDQYYKDDRSITCFFPNTTTGGRSEVRQIITNLCPDSPYILKAGVACDYGGMYGESLVSVAVVIEDYQYHFGTVCDECIQSEGSNCGVPQFRTISTGDSLSPPYIAPRSGITEVRVIFEQEARHKNDPGDPIPPVLALLDLFYMEEQGYTGSPLNPAT